MAALAETQRPDSRLSESRLRCHSVSSISEELALRKLVHLVTHLPGRRPEPLYRQLFTVFPMSDNQQQQLRTEAKCQAPPELALVVRLASLSLAAGHSQCDHLQADLALAKVPKAKSGIGIKIGRWPKPRGRRSDSQELASANVRRSAKAQARIDNLSSAVWQFDETFVFREPAGFSRSCVEISFHGDFARSSLTSTNSGVSAETNARYCVTVPLKDVCGTGCCDASFDVFAGRGSKAKAVGVCTLDVCFVAADALDADASPTEADTGTSVSYGQLYDLLFARVLAFEQRSLSLSQPRPTGRSVNYIERFSPASKNLLAVVECLGYFSSLEVKLFRLSRCLRNVLDGKLADCDSFIGDQVAALKLETMRWSCGNTQSVVSSLRHLDVGSLFGTIERYIGCRLQDFGSLPSLFPAGQADFAVWRQQLKSIVDLQDLEQFFVNALNCDTTVISKTQLAGRLTQRLQQDARAHVQRELGPLQCQEHKEFVLQDIDRMIKVFEDFQQAVGDSGATDDYFREQLGLQFSKIVVLAVDSALMGRTRQLMALLNEYQSRYRNFMSNITDSSKRSLKLYLSIKHFTAACRAFIPERELFKFSLCNLSECFSEASIFWLQTFKVQSQFRISRALEIEKDIVEIDAIVKVSNSVVDVLSVFHKIISEWNDIDLVDCLDNVFGTLKMTDCICDGICFYARKVCEILEANSLFDRRGQQFDVSDQLCISLNNIEHARKFLHSLTSLFMWEDALDQVVLRDDAVDLRERFVRAMQSVIDDANDYVLLKCRTIEKQVAERLQRDVYMHTLYFTQKEPDKRGSIDSLLGYLGANLAMLADKLEDQIAPRMFSAVWSGVLLAFSDTLLAGEKPAYYEMMQKHLQAVKSFFLHRGLIDDILSGDTRYFLLSEGLAHNSKPTERLLLDYYSKVLQNSFGTPSTYLGHLTIKAGLSREANGMLALRCLIVDCKNLPGTGRNSLCDPYVAASLKPETMFTSLCQFRTGVQLQTLNPVFLHSFKVSSIPLEFTREPGCCAHFVVMDREYLRPDRCVGEVLFSLADLDEVSPSLSWEAYPAFMKSIRRPSATAHPTCEDIVRSRCGWDRAADRFTASRHHLQSRYCAVRSQISRRDSSVFSFRRTYDSRGANEQQQQQQQQQKSSWHLACASLASELLDIADTVVCCRQPSVTRAPSASALA